MFNVYKNILYKFYYFKIVAMYVCMYVCMCNYAENK